MGGRPRDRKPQWLLVKVEDAFARAGHVAELLGDDDDPPARPKAPRRRRASTARPSSAAVPLHEFLRGPEPEGDAIVDVEGTAVELTSLDRVYWPKDRITKFELLRYYAGVWPRMKPYLVGRPAILQRSPQGIEAPKFIQHDLGGAPRYVATRTLVNEEGRRIDYAVYTSLASFLYLTNLGTLEHHPWHSTVRDLDRPDWLALDLDPGPRTPWPALLDLALTVRHVCAARGWKAYPKTSGSRGIHVYLPLDRRDRYSEVAERARRIAEEVVARAPRTATIERAKSERKGKVYVDWLQNARGKSMAAPYSARGRPGATVSMPLSWEDLERGVKLSDFTVRTVPAEGPDPWARFFEDRQRLRDSA
jgi:bifunctional non-homologous end joining protein LigD